MLSRMTKPIAALTAVAAIASVAVVPAAQAKSKVGGPRRARISSTARRAVGGTNVNIRNDTNAVPLQGGSTGQGQANDADCAQIAHVADLLMDYGNQRAFANDAQGFNDAYDKAQQYVDQGEAAGCFFIY
jgi:hypothetical protein